MRTTALLILLSASIGWWGCSPCTTKKVACEGFNDPAFDAWFPYSEGSRLVFKNVATADTFSYTISNVYVSEPYEATSGGYNSSRYCRADKSIRSDNNGSPLGYIEIYSAITRYFNDGPVEKGLNIYFKNSSWYAAEANDNEIVAANGGASITKGLDVAFENGQTYPLLCTLITDTNVNKTSTVYKLFVARGKGIVGFETYPSRQKWVIQ